MIKRIGLLTSGGDCQALNATMRGVVKALSNAVDDLEVYGFDDGYKGLIYGKYRMLTAKDFPESCHREERFWEPHASLLN